MTDNKNRTASNVRNAFTKGSGSVGTQGCVSYMFDEKGQIIIDKEECDMEADDLMMIALDAGADDFNEEDDSFEITTAPEDFSAVREALEAENIAMASAEVTMLPQTYVNGSHPCPPYSLGTGIPKNPALAIFATVSTGNCSFFSRK